MSNSVFWHIIGVPTESVDQRRYDPGQCTRSVQLLLRSAVAAENLLQQETWYVSVQREVHTNRFLHSVAVREWSDGNVTIVGRQWPQRRRAHIRLHGRRSHPSISEIEQRGEGDKCVAVSELGLVRGHVPDVVEQNIEFHFQAATDAGTRDATAKSTRQLPCTC